MPKKEADFSFEFKEFVENRLPGVVVIKHCDRFTAGVPDLSFTHKIQTLWVEDKRIKRINHSVHNPKGWMDNAVQLDLAVRLGAWYLVIDPIHDEYLFTPAMSVYQAYYHHELIAEVPGAVCDTGDRWAFYGNVLLTITKELRV